MIKVSAKSNYVKVITSFNGWRFGEYEEDGTNVMFSGKYPTIAQAEAQAKSYADANEIEYRP